MCWFWLRFYILSIRIWNCSHSVVFLFFFYIVFVCFWLWFGFVGSAVCLLLLLCFFHFIISKYIVLIDTCIYDHVWPRIIVPMVICCFCVFDCLFVCFCFFLYFCFCFYLVIFFCLPFSFYYIKLHRVEITIQILI